jgi:hypothetical protein
LLPASAASAASVSTVASSSVAPSARQAAAARSQPSSRRAPVSARNVDTSASVTGVGTTSRAAPRTWPAGSAWSALWVWSVVGSRVVSWVRRAVTAAAVVRSRGRAVVLPVLLGDGVRLTLPGSGTHRLHLASSRTFPDGSVEHLYQPVAD